MSKPLILELEEQIKEIKEKLNWKSQDVDVQRNGNIIIDGIKDAKEVIVYHGNGSLNTASYFTKNMSNMWVISGRDNLRGACVVNFETGQINNGGNDIDLNIKKICYR